MVRRKLSYGLMCAALSTSIGFGCGRVDAFSCSDDASCGVVGTAGRCEPSGFCSFEDRACPSGRRFGTLAADGMADECVAGDPVVGSTGGLDPSGSTSRGGETGHDATSGAPEASDASGSSESTGDGTSSATSGAASSEGSEESSTGAESFGCELFDFEEGAVPFEAQSQSIDVEVLDGQMLASWPAGAAGSALFEVAHGVDLTQGVLDVTFADIAGAPAGTTVSLRWTDPSGRIVAAVLEGASYAVSDYDPMLPELEQTSITVYPVNGREAVRLEAQGDSIVVEAGEGNMFEPLTTLAGGFDLTEVDVELFFDRYAATGEAASIGLASLSLCFE